MDEQSFARELDRVVAALAARQHGVVSRAQLLRLRMGRGAIERRLERGRLHRMHRGVYAVGHRQIGREGHARGYTVIRITWRQLEEAPHEALADIRVALSACRLPRSGRPPAAARCA